MWSFPMAYQYVIFAAIRVLLCCMYQKKPKTFFNGEHVIVKGENKQTAINFLVCCLSSSSKTPNATHHHHTCPLCLGITTKEDNLI